MAHFSESAPERQTGRRCWLLLAFLVSFSGCGTLKPPPEAPAVRPPTAPAIDVPPAKPPAAGIAGVLRQAVWTDLPEWRAENPALAWDAFLLSCSTLSKQDGWRDACAAAEGVRSPDGATARRFFEDNFTPFRITNADGTDEGMITGYYEPLLKGSRTPSARYRYPVFGVPADLLVIDLADVHPELKGMRLRGRLDGRRVVPYFDRGQIEQGHGALAAKEIAWVEDPIELFFLHIQGSGHIALEGGDTMRVGYAEHNGHPYRSIGRILVERGELPLEKASMQGIKAWATQHPDRVRELLNQNASYVFFRELPKGLSGPLGTLGVPLSSRRSIAVDQRFVPLGAPVFIATTWPASGRPLNRLMLAQDTGGAIRGPVRADFFWGFGDEAAREAGRMKQPLRMWVLLPNAFRVPQNQ